MELNELLRSGGPISHEEAGRLIDAGADALDAGDAEAALERFWRAAGSGDLNLAGRASIGAAEALVRLGRDDEARELLHGASQSGEQEVRFVARRRLAALHVTAGRLQDALGEYQRAERDAPNDRARAEVASRIGWLIKETGGSGVRARLAFARSRGGVMDRVAPTAALLITGVVSAAALAFPRVLEPLALIKVDSAGGDFLSTEPWRLLTVALVHGSPLHLLFNLFALDLGARLVQRLYGTQRLALWYLLGVLGASLASAIWTPQIPSVGASGGVFALFGVALGAEWAHRPLVERGVRAALAQIGGLIAINLVFGLGLNVVGGGIDNAAHLGGLALGLLLGVLVPPTRAESMRSRWAGVISGDAGREQVYIALVAIGLLFIFLNWYPLALMRTTLPI
ncbi:MAG: rhomboid family intramembrane serine protease [Candidatus Limnocylindrus sp.]